MIRWLDVLLTDWAGWTRGLHSTALGYPTRTAETRVLEGRSDTPGGRARVPSFSLPQRLLEADRALRDMPSHLRVAIDVRYLEDLDREGQERAFSARTRRGRRAYYTRLECAHWWLAGRLGRGA